MLVWNANKMTDNKKTHECEGCEKEFPMEALLMGDMCCPGDCTWWCEACWLEGMEGMDEEEKEHPMKQYEDWKKGKKWWEYEECCDCKKEHHTSEYQYMRPFADGKGSRPVCDPCHEIHQENKRWEAWRNRVLPFLRNWMEEYQWLALYKTAESLKIKDLWDNSPEDHGASIISRPLDGTTIILPINEKQEKLWKEWLVDEFGECTDEGETWGWGQ